MTGHRVTVDDDGFHGIHVTCIDCDDLDQHGIGTREWADLVAHNHQLETRCDDMTDWLRRQLRDSERAGRQFPPSGHYAGGHTNALRKVWREWTGETVAGQLGEMQARLDACGSHDERRAELHDMSREAQRRRVLRAIPGGHAS